ncbi:MAG: 2,3-diphosphoglycerate-dependent phosphoglycerate mutase [Nitrospirae bacterium]|nr:2,3-diphosphoglycerate-dependent phosphoglycerate mutase [Nitrospirota bacterium]
MPTLTLLRHGKSIWNKEKRFTGWTDIALSKHGISEAERAGQMLKDHGLKFDLCFTSCLNRATETLRIVLDIMNQSGIPIQKSWRLNERHYGALQGLDWWEATRKYGAKQLLIWQRHFDIPPPPLDVTDTRFPGHDPLYSKLSPDELPRSESLKDTLARLLPFWHGTIVPELQQQKRILIVAHNNSLRSLLKHVDDITDKDIPKITIRTADPIVYELDDQMRPYNRLHLQSPSKLTEWAQGKLGNWVTRFSENKK